MHMCSLAVWVIAKVAVCAGTIKSTCVCMNQSLHGCYITSTHIDIQVSRYSVGRCSIACATD